MKKILIVDDDPDDMDFLCEAIHTYDNTIKCIWVSDGMHAIKLLKEENFVLPEYIFLDLNMPRMDGKQCLVLLKADPRLADIPIIIYTTSKLQQDIRETKELGVVYFLTKPTKMEDLEKYVSYVLQGKWEMMTVN